MPREMMKKAGTAAVETTLRAAMPGLEQALTAIREDIRSLREEVRTDIRTLDAKVENVRQEMLDRFESMLSTVNEVSHRVTRLDGKLEGYTEAMGLRLTLNAPGKASRKRRAG